MGVMSRYMDIYNNDRLHQALNMKYPCESEFTAEPFAP
jgi:hypothetical protein